jgi:hypothetical protein
MTKDVNPEKLKAKAQELLNKAKEIEEMEIYTHNFTGYPISNNLYLPKPLTC